MVQYTQHTVFIGVGQGIELLHTNDNHTTYVHIVPYTPGSLSGLHCLREWNMLFPRDLGVHHWYLPKSSVLEATTHHSQVWYTGELKGLYMCVGTGRQVLYMTPYKQG